MATCSYYSVRPRRATGSGNGGLRVRLCGAKLQTLGTEGSIAEGVAAIPPSTSSKPLRRTRMIFSSQVPGSQRHRSAAFRRGQRNPAKMAQNRNSPPSRRSGTVPRPVRWPMTDDHQRMWCSLILPPCAAGARSSKNAPNTATLCHFFAPLARPQGAATGSASRCHIMRSDLRRGRPGDPETEWHRCTGNGHRGGSPMSAMAVGGGRQGSRRRQEMRKDGYAVPRGMTAGPVFTGEPRFQRVSRGTGRNAGTLRDHRNP
jgi:hypothetical protein